MGSTIACCFGNAFCSLCCSACPSCKGSTSTRFAYSLLLFAGLIISCITLLFGLGDRIMKIPQLCEYLNSTNRTSSCEDIVGSRVVYRIAFGMTIFFVLLSALMVRVKTSNDRRAKIQNGFWGIKLLILAGITFGSMFIESNHLDFIWMIFGLIGGFFFILIQLFLSINFVHKWNESWVDHVETGSKKHGYGLLLCTFLFYTMTIIGVILLYTTYGSQGRSINKFFILFNMCLCIAFSIVSISPRVRAYNSSCGLLQSSLVSLYIIYYTWSAMSNSQSSYTLTSRENLAHPITIIGLIMFIFALFYSVLTSSRNNRTRKLFFSFTSADSGILDDAQLINSTVDEKWILSSNEENHQKVYDDECGSVCYNYSLFHLMFVSATLYVMMILTNWYNPNEMMDMYGRNQAGVWVKIVASWICVLLYIWSCIAPAVFPDRDFS